MIDTNMTWLERRIFGGTNGHLFLNKGNQTQGLVNTVSLWWLIIDNQSIVNIIMNKELEKDIRHACGRFFRVQCLQNTG